MRCTRPGPAARRHRLSFYGKEKDAWRSAADETVHHLLRCPSYSCSTVQQQHAYACIADCSSLEYSLCPKIIAFLGLGTETNTACQITKNALAGRRRVRRRHTSTTEGSRERVNRTFWSLPRFLPLFHILLGPHAGQMLQRCNVYGGCRCSNLWLLSLSRRWDS